MKLYQKILIALGGIIVVGLLGVIVYQQFELRQRQETIEQQVVAQKQLADQLVRSQSAYATKDDVNNLIKNSGLSLQQIRDDLAKLSADVSSVNKVVVNSKGVVEDHVSSTGTGQKNTNPTTPTCKDGSECTGADPFGYQKNEQKLTLTEPFGNTQVPIGDVGFSAWQDKPWSLNVLPRQYSITSVVGTDENERQYFYNKFQVKVGDKTYDLQIAQAQTTQVYPSPKFSWWNPRLFLGMDAGVNFGSPIRAEFAPNVGLGLMSYGRYKTTPDFSILEIGGGYAMQSKRFQFMLTPFSYNIGRHIPFMNNTYVGPSIGLSPQGDFSVMAGIRVGL